MIRQHLGLFAGAVLLSAPSCTGDIESGVSGGTTDSLPYTPPAGCDRGAAPAHVIVHRLNRVEYNNTIRDLLGDTSNPADEFPPDDGSGGFDNNSSVLNIQADLFSKYEVAAQRLAAKHLPDLLTCKPASAAEKSACARTILEPLARRAWRRPVTAEETNELAALVQKADADNGSFDKAMELAVGSVLLSPNFLFRAELPPAAPGGPAYSLDAYSLASRLSYFLWSSMPDETLLAAAESGRLLKPDELAAQITRMLADPMRAGAIGENLSGQWLLGRRMDDAAPDVGLYPQFDTALRTGAQQETAMFVNAFIQENLDLRTLLDADFTFINERLARHYGIADPAIKGTTLKRVSLENNTQRGGILTHAAFLTGTSNADQPGIARRGVWVLSNLLCSQPPEPPPGAQAKQQDIEKSLPANPTRRDKAYARDATGCGSCHKSFDPIGLGLDKYDAIGAWREKDGGQPIVIHEEWNGTTFTGPRPMTRLIRDDGRLPGCITQVLFRYALGRINTKSDQCTLDGIATATASKDFRARDVLSAIATSPAFRFQGTE